MNEDELRAELHKLILEYNRRFKGGLPMHMVRYSDEEWYKVIRKCLEENKPFELPERYNELMKIPGLCF